MSAQAPRDRPGPLNQRTPSQKNKLAIRVVPYSPPRIQSDGSSPSQLSPQHPHAPGGSRGVCDDQPTSGESWTRTPGESGEEKEHLVSSPGSALSSPPSHSLRLVEHQGQGVSDSSDTEALRPLPSPVLVSPSDVAQPATTNQSPTLDQHERPVGATQLRPLSRNRNFVAIHSDKTFSLVRQAQRLEDPSRNFVSPPPPSHSSRASSSIDQRPSIGEWSDGRVSSSLTNTTGATIPDSSPSPCPPSPSSSTTQLAEDPITSSPWNYRLTGGLRKVPKTPDLKQKSTTRYPTSPTEDSPLSPLPENPIAEEIGKTASRSVITKPSFASTETTSTVAETTNYKIYGHSPAQISTDSLGPPSSSHSNYRLLGESSPAPTPFDNSNYEILGQSSPAAPFDNSNYEILGESSPAAPFDNSNYEILGESSPAAPFDNSNYEILGESSPAAPFNSSPPDTSDSNENYVLHGEPSPSPSVAVARKPRPTYSQESLRVPPLRPSKKRASRERYGYYKQRSRENLRVRAGSVKTIASLSSAARQDTRQALLVAPVTRLDLQAAPSSPQSTPGNNKPQQQLRNSWEASQPAAGSSAGHSRSPSNSPPPRSPMIQAHPHQWSSQLSTVMSESEGSSRGNSPPASRTSTGNGAGHRRRSSAGWASSMHSRQLQSISSSLAAQLEEGAGDSTGSISRSDSVERPYPAYTRAGPLGPRLVRDQDEDGDGLADLHQMSPRPSKTGLSGFFGSSDSSSRKLHSSGSSRANSFNSALIPAWAKVYYGSGERRFLGAPSISGSDAGDTPPSSAAFFGSGSPNTDHFPLAMYTPRRRANQVVPPPDDRPFSGSGSMDITAQPAAPGDYSIFRTLKKKTSSIWSPHLAVDRRASRYSIWDPPSVSWSADNGLLGKRNLQVLLFIVGFIFPLTWMIAALLPLPPNPQHQMVETGQVQSRFGPVDYAHQLRFVDETRYQSARWWRNLNRVMSIMGLLIIGAVVALAVIGTRQGWTLQSSTRTVA